MKLPRHSRYELFLFRHFRTVWSPRASFHLTTCRAGHDWRSRFISLRWLLALNGAAPSCNFGGI